MMFSVNQLWERWGVPLPELSITLATPVYGKREFFLSLSGVTETPDFLVVPHIPADWTFTVRGMCPAPERFVTGTIETKRIPPQRPARTKSFASRCCPLRL